MRNNKKLFLGAFLASFGSIAIAGTPNGIIAVPQAIPAISQAGLIGLAFIIGIVGARLISRMKASNN